MAEAQTLNEQVAKCRAIADSGVRLKCYDGAASANVQPNATAQRAQPNANARYDAQIKKAKVAISKGLKDPSSAQFRNVFLSRTDEAVWQKELIACGEINGKNSFGGYVGFRRFVIDESEMLQQIEEPNGSLMDHYWSKFCNRRAYPQ